jgi:hypothetical protein
VVVKGAQGLRVERPGCGSAEGAQADGAGGVGGAVEKVSGGDGVAAGVGEIACAQLCCGEVDEGEDAATAGGRWELVECGGECGLGCIVVAGLEMYVAGGRE